MYDKNDEKWNAAKKQEEIFRNRCYEASRSGDTYLREVYKSLCFVLFDKFGENGLNKYYKIIYRLVYVERLEKKTVKYNAVKKLPGEWFKIIIQAKTLTDLSDLEKLSSNIKINGDISVFGKNFGMDIFEGGCK